MNERMQALIANAMEQKTTELMFAATHLRSEPTKADQSFFPFCIISRDVSLLTTKSSEL
jgi:hypothetical protein